MSLPVDRFRKHPYITTFILTFLLLVLYSLIQGIFPFGEYTFLRKDLYHQYLPFLTEFRRRLTEGSGLKYSFRLGLGAPFYPLYVYYLSDPLNYLSVLIPEGYLLEYMTFVAYIKMALAASFMCRYLRYKGKNERIVYAVMLGVCYGMSGFMAAYDWNVMWLWGIALAPLVLMGAEKIANGESPLQYTLTMTLTVMTNYYIAMVVGIFLIAYFITVSVDNFKGIKNTFRSWVRLFFSTLLSAGLSAFLLLPEAAAIKETSFTGINMPDTLEFYMSVPTLMMRSLAAVRVETGLTHEPNIYASIPVLALAFLFFVNSRFSIPQKICRGLLIIFLYFSFNTNVLEYIWHGMNYPDSLPARQGFLFIIIMIMTAYEGLDGADRMGARRLALPLVIPVLFLATGMIFAQDDSHVLEHTWLINAVFIVLYLSFFVYRIIFRAGYTRRGIYVFSMILMTELLLNFNVTSSRDISREGYFTHVESFAALRDMAEGGNKLNQGHFTRFDAVEESIRNDACLTGYKGDAFFSSTINSEAEDFYEAFGMKSSRVHYMASGLTPFTEAILGVDYILAADFRNNETDYDVAYYTGEYDDDYLYRCLYRLPFGYTVPSGIYKLADISPASDPVKRQNIVALRLMGEPVFEEAQIYDVKKGSGNMFFRVPEDGHYYAYTDSDTDEIKEYTAKSEEAYGDFDEMKYESIMDLGRLDKNDWVRLEAINEHEAADIDVSVYRFMPGSMVKAEEALGGATLTLTDFSDDHIEGIADMQEGTKLVLAMPYDRGWEITIDGDEKIEPERFYDFLIMLPLPKGLHHVSLTYHIPYLKQGVLLSILSLAICFIAFFGRRKTGIHCFLAVWIVW
jgi:uncharacterized membrane protein YfhO